MTPNLLKLVIDSWRAEPASVRSRLWQRSRAIAASASVAASLSVVHCFGRVSALSMYSFKQWRSRGFTCKSILYYIKRGCGRPKCTVRTTCVFWIQLYILSRTCNTSLNIKHVFNVTHLRLNETNSWSRWSADLRRWCELAGRLHMSSGPSLCHIEYTVSHIQTIFDWLHYD